MRNGVGGEGGRKDRLTVAEGLAFYGAWVHFFFLSMMMRQREVSRLYSVSAHNNSTSAHLVQIRQPITFWAPEFEKSESPVFSVHSRSCIMCPPNLVEVIWILLVNHELSGLKIDCGFVCGIVGRGFVKFLGETAYLRRERMCRLILWFLTSQFLFKCETNKQV